jgi:hypothetical protein
VRSRLGESGHLRYRETGRYASLVVECVKLCRRETFEPRTWSLRILRLMKTAFYTGASSDEHLVPLDMGATSTEAATFVDGSKTPGLNPRGFLVSRGLFGCGLCWRALGALCDPFP